MQSIFDLIIGIGILIASLITTLAIIIYIRRLEKTEITKPWILILIAMVMFSISEIVNLFSTYSLRAPDLIHRIFELFGMLFIAIAIFRLLFVDFSDTKKKIKKLEIRASTDSLSGLGNHQYFEDYLDIQVVYHRNTEEPLSLVFLDLDQFKMVNDTYGHAVGDQAVRIFANILTSSIRNKDLAARIGGDEFALILPNTPLEEAYTVAERIRKTLEKTHISIDKQNNPLTCSAGISGLEKGGRKITRDELYKLTDQALYRAKAKGWNVVITNRI